VDDVFAEVVDDVFADPGSLVIAELGMEVDRPAAEGDFDE
jgi:hypothetical protein